MSNPASLYGKTAVVTGASSGIGRDIARQLAKYGCDLVLVARREERLRILQQELVKAHARDVLILPFDLAAPGAIEALYQQTGGSGRVVDILVNNAGFAIYEDYPDIPWERERLLYEVNMLAVTHLTRCFLKDMLARNQGYILLVASIMGYFPVPVYTTYSASKAFLMNYGLSLSYELRKTGVSVTTVAPGATDTEFLQVSGQKLNLAERFFMMKSSDVARSAVQAMLQRRVKVVIGTRNILVVALLRLLPDRVASWLAHAIISG
ncbi:MAG: SDR family NAD(P)-dependent oxidoreductase [Omnitrophica WOR_2 bacterium]